MAKLEQLTKLTLKGMEAQPSMDDLAKLEKQGKGTVLELCDVFGIVRKFKPGQNADGKPWIKFYGQFKGINLRTKNEYLSGVGMFPKMIEESLYAVMGSAEEVGDVQFGFRIGVKFDASSATKYVYTAAALTKPTETDPLVMLEKSIKQAALPAPK